MMEITLKIMGDDNPDEVLGVLKIIADVIEKKRGCNPKNLGDPIDGDPIKKVLPDSHPMYTTKGMVDE